MLRSKVATCSLPSRRPPKAITPTALISPQGLARERGQGGIQGDQNQLLELAEKLLGERLLVLRALAASVERALEWASKKTTKLFYKFFRPVVIVAIPLLEKLTPLLDTVKRVGGQLVTPLKEVCARVSTQLQPLLALLSQAGTNALARLNPLLNIARRAGTSALEWLKPLLKVGRRVGSWLSTMLANLMFDSARWRKPKGLQLIQKRASDSGKAIMSSGAKLYNAFTRVFRSGDRNRDTPGAAEPGTQPAAGELELVEPELEATKRNLDEAGAFGAVE